MKFVERLSKPDTSNKFYISYKHGGYNTCIILDDKNGNVLPNCVGYAQGRLLEILGVKKVNWKLPACNAEDWISMAESLGMKTGATPKLGAVIVWAKGKLKSSADGAGHVAVVEKINADGTIVTSESGYKSASYFWTKTRKNDGNWGQSSSYRFLGFVYCGVDFEVEAVPKVVSGAKVELNNTPCYTSSSKATAYTNKTGTFYYWDNKIINGRVRITNSPSRVGVAGQVTCWIKA